MMNITAARSAAFLSHFFPEAFFPQEKRLLDSTGFEPVASCCFVAARSAAFFC